MFTLTCSQIRRIDQLAVEEFDMPSIILMENAARSAAEIIKQEFADLEKPRVVIFCGPGNNGGDGFAIARHLHNANWQVIVILACPVEKLIGDALTNYKILVKMELPIFSADAAERCTNESDIIIDALLGTGSHGKPWPIFATLIEIINTAGKPVVAVDLPSGFDCYLGKAEGIAIKADITITFVAVKDTFLLETAKSFVGKLHVASIGIPNQLITQAASLKM